ncbi:MAG: sigma-70 family RNA polymerase sigma factor, partial [Caulobacterales bacterium]|nr:sigma-70 family RNA polymerase sigma factor [Caulobacterales bacterium]
PRSAQYSSQNISDKPSPHQEVESREQWRLLAEAVSTLPPQCQRVFVLKKVYGHSNKEIAAQLGISTSTVEKHIASGLRRAGDYLARRADADAATATAMSGRAGPDRRAEGTTENTP